MSIKIRKNIVSSSVNKAVTYGGTNTKKYIVIHETANTSKGANADAHGRLQANGNSRSASWHYTVDDKEIVQSFSDNAQCWHAGSASYNRNSIGIEICVNSDGNYKKAVDKAVELTKYLMSKHGISSANVIQHNRASGKDCPRYLRAGSKGVTWSEFKRKVGGKAPTKVKTESTSKSPSKPTSNKPSTSAKLTVDGKWGGSTSRALQRALGTTADGVISSQPRNAVTNALYGGVTFGSNGSPMVRALQRKVGASADGKLGPATIRSLQAYLGTTRDGVLSRPSMVVRELQRRLNAGTF